MRPMQVGSGKRGGTSSNDEGSLDQYLREISRYPLINQEEEVRLAQLIRKADEEAGGQRGEVPDRKAGLSSKSQVPNSKGEQGP